jgi:uncharacterized protein (TIRG00374 family)
MATVGVAGTSGGVHSLRALAGVVVVVALALLIRLDGAGLAQIVTTLGRARYWWLIPAIVAEAMSMGAMAAQQRQLLGVQGARHPLRTVAATTLASNTISTSLPIVGSPAAAVYAYKRYAKLGGGGAVAGWALAVTGICSSLALATIVALGGILSGNLAASLVGGLAIVLGVVPLGVGLLMLQRRVVCRCVERIGIAATSVLHRVLRRRLGEKISVVRCVQRVATLRLTRRDAARVFASSLLNWLLDMACLGCAILALDGNVPWQKLVLVWAAGAGASSFHLTPGGLGVVEAALTLALVGAGVPASIAIAVVVLYRAVSFWLVLLVGATVLCTVQWQPQRTSQRTSQRVSADPVDCVPRCPRPTASARAGAAIAVADGASLAL